MSAEGSDIPQPDSARGERLAVVMALGIEKLSLQAAVDSMRPAGPVQLVQCGPGAACAERAARAAVASGATALISWGLAGGLEPGLEPGDVVLPKRIVAARGLQLEVDEPWSARLAERLQAEFDVHRGDLLAAEQVLETPRAKARAAVETGCVAVDMESGAVASVAADAGIPVLVVRVIADCILDTLPPGIAGWVTPEGERRLAPVLNAIFTPSQWGDLARLAHRHRVADRTLDRLASRLVATAFERVLTPPY